MIPLCLTHGNIRYIWRVKWSNPGKGVAPSPTPRCRSYWKGSLLVALDYSRQLYVVTHCNSVILPHSFEKLKHLQYCNFILHQYILQLGICHCTANNFFYKKFIFFSKQIGFLKLFLMEHYIIKRIISGIIYYQTLQH